MKILVLMMMLSINVFAADEYFYSVPVKDPVLERYATFKLKARTVTKDNDITISYKLPEELVGKNHAAIVLRGADYGDENYTLTAPNAEAQCQKIEERSMCTINYKNLKIDKKDVSDAIREKAVTLREIRARERVAKIFSGDPVGILFFTSSQKPY